MSDSASHLLKPKNKRFFLVLLLFSANFANAQVNRISGREISNRCIPVCITTQPLNQPAICVANGTMTFTVAVSGTAPFTYQWRENSTIISDGGVYGGSMTPSLTITNPPYSLNGKIYRCIITNCSGNSSAITTANTVLSLYTLPTDLNKDGVTNIYDFFLLNALYGSACTGCPEDITQNGFINSADFLLLLGQFNRTCQ